MVYSDEIYQRRRLRTAYLTTIVSITLVLFMLGLLGLIVLYAQKLSDHVRENIGFEIIMNPGVKEARIIEFQKGLDLEDYVKSTEYITKEEATRRFSQELGADFIQFIGEENNPLLPSVDVRFRAGYANNDSLAGIEQQMLSNTDVKEVVYQKSLIHLINRNIRRIGGILLSFSGLLLLIAIALINNTIRLSVYSKRFIIRTMQLVGATEGFIRRPFMNRGLGQGLIGALIAISMLSGVIYIAQRELPELVSLQQVDLFLSLFGIVLFFGLIIAWISTLLAVRKYLRISTDRLYY